MMNLNHEIVDQTSKWDYSWDILTSHHLTAKHLLFNICPECKWEGKEVEVESVMV